MLKPEQTHQQIIHRIIDNHFKENDYDLNDAFESTISHMYAKFKNLGDVELCSKMFPYLQFERNNTFVSELLTYKKQENFKNILYESILNNADILAEHSYEKYVLYRKAKEVLDPERLKKIECNLFLDFSVFQTKEDNIDTISFNFDTMSLFNKMNEETLLFGGRSVAAEFMKFIRGNYQLKIELQVSLILEYQTNKPNIIKLVFIEPKDKNLVRDFVDNMPTILEEMLPFVVDKGKFLNIFSNYEDRLLKHINALKLQKILDTKEQTKFKLNKI